MPGWDVVIRLLEAGNKYLFGLFIVGCVVGSGAVRVDENWTIVGIVLAIFCAATLVFDGAGKLLPFIGRTWAQYKTNKAAKVRREEDELAAKLKADALKQERAVAERKALASAADLDPATRKLFELLICREQPRFHASRAHPVVRKLHGRGLIVYEEKSADLYDQPMYLPDFVIKAHASQKESFRRKYPSWSDDLRIALSYSGRIY